MKTRVPPRLAPVLVTVITVAAGLAPAVRAGCLAPSDAIVDGAGAVGAFWGNGDGGLLYVRDVTGNGPQLMRRTPQAGSEILLEAGTRNGYSETWAEFHSGTLSSQGVMAFVASTTVDDDPQTPVNEGLARRGAYVLRGNTPYRIGRYGEPSPIRGGLGEAIPWASFFDAAAERRSSGGFARALFSAQLGAPDGRTGIFRWEEESFTITPIVLVGDPSPSGGTITTVARLRANEAGDAAFFALSRVGEADPIPGLFLALEDGSRLRIVRFGLDGDAAPGGGRFAILNDFGIADDGSVVFSATLASAPSPTALFRAAPPSFVPEVVVREGATTPLGGSFGSFEPAKVRLTPSGELVFGVRLSEDVGGEGVFSVASPGAPVLPLANPESSLAVAALGGAAAAYQTVTETHTVVPADGSQEGPDDFRVTKLDLRNNVPLRQDAIRFSGAFRLPAVGEGPGATPPVVLGLGNVERLTPDRAWSGDDLVRIQQVRVQVSQSPGNTFVFGMDNAGGGTLTFNGVAQGSPKVKLAADGSSAKWSFRANVGRGKLTVDLAKGTFDLRLAEGTINPSFEAAGFRVGFTLLTDDDVAAGRDPQDAFFHHSFPVGAQQKPYGRGRRVVSRGESVIGGTLFVDGLTVKRKLKTVKGQAAPIVDSDTLDLQGTLRICPGSTPPGTPGLGASLRVGDLDLSGIALVRRGRSGSSYRYKSAKGAVPAVTFDVDVVKGTFRLKAKRVPPLSQLVDADFSGASPTNRSDTEVGGMAVPFALWIDRVYEGDFDIPMTRAKGAKAFTR